TSESDILPPVSSTTAIQQVLAGTVDLAVVTDRPDGSYDFVGEVFDTSQTLDGVYWVGSLRTANIRRIRQVRELTDNRRRVSGLVPHDGRGRSLSSCDSARLVSPGSGGL